VVQYGWANALSLWLWVGKDIQARRRGPKIDGQTRFIYIEYLRRGPTASYISRKEVWGNAAHKDSPFPRTPSPPSCRSTISSPTARRAPIVNDPSMATGRRCRHRPWDFLRRIRRFHAAVESRPGGRRRASGRGEQCVGCGDNEAAATSRRSGCPLLNPVRRQEAHDFALALRYPKCTVRCSLVRGPSYSPPHERITQCLPLAQLHFCRSTHTRGSTHRYLMVATLIPPPFIRRTPSPSCLTRRTRTRTSRESLDTDATQTPALSIGSPR